MIRKPFIRKWLFSGSLFFLIFGLTNINAQETETKPKKIVIISTTIDDKGNEITERKILEGKAAETYLLEEQGKSTPVTADEKVRTDRKKQIIITTQTDGSEITEQQIELGNEDIEVVEGNRKIIIQKLNSPENKEQGDDFTFMSTEEEEEGAQVEVEKTVELLPDGSEKTVITKTIIKPATNSAFLGVAPGDAIIGGVLLELIIENSPADKAGLKKGDIITQINETTINTFKDITKALATFQPEETINIGYTRDGKKNQTKATLAKANKNAPTKIWKTEDGEEIELKDGQKIKFIKEEGDGN
jgi:type II secretory pathway component PulC